MPGPGRNEPAWVECDPRAIWWCRALVLKTPAAIWRVVEDPRKAAAKCNSAEKSREISMTDPIVSAGTSLAQGISGLPMPELPV